ncbi:MAG: phage shock protein operon transcriptional activator [Halioglobus sp.]|nr:phage shock protein operon transcriptional activator [Halioglobus sp.]
MRTQESIIGNSPALAEALDQLSQLARINRPILLLGERGTGKELAAQRLHFLSPRWQAPLVKVNCAALADSLLESELFGHEPGAFTGATRTRQGRFERADGGTLFLDELGTMSMRLQEKLLRLIEYGEFERLGGQQTLQVDVRVVAATNTDLRAQVAQHQFRADLLDRLSFDVVHIPALRHRREDILELAQHFAVQMCAELGWSLFAGFSDAALRDLQRYNWPGNIRELKNAVERSLFRWDNPDNPVDSVIIDPFVSPFETEEEVTAETPQAGSAAQEGETEQGDQEAGDFQARVKQLEVTLLSEALAKNGYNQRRAANALGLSYDQMRGLVRKYKLANRTQAARP